MSFNLLSTPSNLNSVGKCSSNVLKHLFLLNNKEQFRCHSLRAWVYNPSTWHVLVRRLFASLIVASLCFTVLGGELRFPYILGKHLALEPPRIHLVVWFRDSL